MEDYLIKEIDRLGEMLIMIARRLGMYKESNGGIPIEDLKSEVVASGLGLDIDGVLEKENPIVWLVEQKDFSDKALEIFSDILMHTDISEETKQSFLREATDYLDSKGHFSFLLHSYLAS